MKNKSTHVQSTIACQQVLANRW